MSRNHQEDRLHCQIAGYLRLAEPPGFFWTSIENRGEGQQAGAGVVVVRSVDDVFHALKEAGVPVRATPA